MIEYRLSKRRSNIEQSHAHTPGTRSGKPRMSRGLLDAITGTLIEARASPEAINARLRRMRQVSVRRLCRVAAPGAMSALSLTAPRQPGVGELLKGHGVNWPPHALLHVD